jgi:protein involved in polysaccharide export with SLBB domain
MKLIRKLFTRGLVAISAVFLGGVLLTGCHTTDEAAGDAADIASTTDRLAVSEQVRVNFSGTIDAIPAHEERIKEDGTITLPLIGAVKAVGKSPGELQKEIHDLYVPKYYVRLTVTVTSQERVFYVGGQVRSPGRQAYIGEITVTKAIQSAGDFTDFADRKRVKLIRPGQKPVMVNCIEALADPSKDPAVFPGDKIVVEQRWW